jgi:acyl dehydratase
MRLYFEDFVTGSLSDLGACVVTEQEIVSFATSYDPQPFHIDPSAAEQSFFGGLIASGVHTLALYMRLLADGVLIKSASLGSPGIDRLRWQTPLRPGDTLRGSYTVHSARPSASRRGVGIVHGLGQGVNQDDEIVISMSIVNMFARRPGGSPGA